MERFNLFKNLMVMAAADGHFAKEEIDFLSLRASRWGLDDQQFDEALAYASQDDADLLIPETREERLELMRNLLLMMAADGVLAPQEQTLFARAAAKMEIDPGELDRLIDELLST